jgi:hypothetical protein
MYTIARHLTKNGNASKQWNVLDSINQLVTRCVSRIQAIRVVDELNKLKGDLNVSESRDPEPIQIVQVQQGDEILTNVADSGHSRSSDGGSAHDIEVRGQGLGDRQTSNEQHRRSDNPNGIQNSDTRSELRNLIQSNSDSLQQSFRGIVKTARDAIALSGEAIALSGEAIAIGRSATRMAESIVAVNGRGTNGRSTIGSSKTLEPETITVTAIAE